MATAVREGVQEQILQIGPTLNSTTLTGTIPAQPASVVVIDWINGYCVNPTAVATYGTTITVVCKNKEGSPKTFCMAYDDGFPSTASTVRSCYASFLGGCASVTANQSTFAPRLNEAVDVTVSIDGVAGSDGWLGANVGYHYEAL